MTRQVQRWHIYQDIDELVSHAERAVMRAAAQARVRRGRFDLVLAGGTTPRTLYERLAAANAGSVRWQVWFGDERCLPEGHAERNESMARDAWLSASDIPEQQIHAIRGGLDPETAARSYAGALAGVEAFDLVLLGIGEDGHTASLFPGQPKGLDQGAADAVGVTDAPKPPPERVSMSASRLSRARQVLVLATGASKAEAVARWRRGEDLPIAHITPPSGVDILVDPHALPSPDPQ